MDNRGGCARCGFADAKLYECTYVSIDADGTVLLCESCLRDVLDRQRAAVEQNTALLPSVLKFRGRGLIFAALALVMLFLAVLFLLVPFWSYNPGSMQGPYVVQPSFGVPYYPPISGAKS